MSVVAGESERVSVLASIEHVIEALLTPQSVVSVLQTATNCIAKIIDVEGAGVATLDPGESSYTILRSGEHAPRILGADTPTLFVATTGEMLLYSARDIPAARGGFDQQRWLASHDRLPDSIETILILPLVAGDSLRGAMYIVSESVDRFDPWFVEQARALAAIVAMALERVHKSDRARQQVEDIRVTNEVLAVANREFEDFAQMASSDLQDPLRKIIAFGEQLEASAVDQLTDRELDYLARINSASDRMQNLIDDLLSFSCVHSQDAPHEPVDLTLVLADVLSDLELSLAESGGRLRIGELPTVFGNPTQLRQVFQNLVGNALKFVVDGRPPVISVRVRSLTDTTATIEVADNGIGFDMAFHDRIFKPFQRLNGVQDYRGSGIGLSICRRIVERHGGTIAATSTVGEGTTFVVTLARRGNQS